MFNFIVSLFIFFKMVSNHQLVVPGSADELLLANDKILGVIDDVFITLRISETFRRYKRVPEYMSIHNYIQDAVEIRNKKYKELYNITKVTPCDKAAYYVSVINKAIGEMISEHKATTDLYFAKENTELVPIASGDVMTDFVNMAKQLRLQLNLTNSILPVKDTAIARNPETRRIYAGVETELRDWPFIVSINIAGKFTCAGSIIREDLILSAATCFKRFYKKKLKKKFKSNILIRAGSHFYNSGGVVVRVCMLYFHPKFDLQNTTNNIAVAQLKLRLILKHRRIQLIKFARVKTSYKDVNIVGWGNRNYESRSASESPEIVRVTEVSEEMDLKKKKDKHNRRNFGDAQQQFEDGRLLHSVLDGYRMRDCVEKYPNYTITSKNFCAGARRIGSGACKYDVGGPGVIGNRLEGVVSFGPSRCGTKNMPTVFTRVYRYARWFDKLFCKIPMTNETVDDSRQTGGLEDIGPDGRKIRKYPFVAAIFVKKKFVCTGAILRQELVITVASCLKPYNFLNEGTWNRRKFTFNTNVEVRVGSDLYTSGPLIPVVNFHYHHYFKQETLNFNLVILVLKHKMEFLKGEVGGIHISRHRVLKSKYKRLNVVGWGAYCPITRNGQRNVPPVLLRAEVLEKTWFRECRKNFTRNRKSSYYLTRLHSCLETGRWGDDSPGNLAILKNKLFGLLSLDCSRRAASSPSVFIKVGVFSWWINRIMCQYKERLDPSDLSKVSDYGSVELTTSEENVIINGPKIHCHDAARKHEKLNCTSINATTYYCERLVFHNGERKTLYHGTPIKCLDLDRWHGVFCIRGNESQKNRDDISRSVINWPHGSTHTGSLYHCEPYSKNSTNMTCSGEGIWTTCDEHNCTFTESFQLFQCTHRHCYHAWFGYGYVYCTIHWQYCKDLRLRILNCPTSTRFCYKNSTHNLAYCQFNDCNQKWLDGDPDQLITECHRQHSCYSLPFYQGIRCREAYLRDCTRIENNPRLNYNNAFVCQKRKCILNTQTHQLICAKALPIYCVDHDSNYMPCPVYTVTNCSKLENYIYKETFICWYKKCTITRVFDIYHSCDKNIEVKCHVNSRGARKNIPCPTPGQNCRTITVYGYDPYESTTVIPDAELPTIPEMITANSYEFTDGPDEITTAEPTTAAPYDAYYCASASVCFYLDDFLVTCEIDRLYCLNDTIYEYRVVVPCPKYVLNDRTGIDNDNDGYYGDNEGDDLNGEEESQLTTYVSPGEIQTDMTALRDRKDDGGDDGDLDNDDSQLTTYASPGQIQTDASALRARTDSDDNSQLITYASPRQSQIDIPALRARTDDDNDDGESDNDDLQLTTYTSPGQNQIDMPELRARTDEDDDDTLLDVYKENDAIDYTFEIGNENSSQIYVSW